MPNQSSLTRQLPISPIKYRSETNRLHINKQSNSNFSLLGDKNYLRSADLSVKVRQMQAKKDLYDSSSEEDNDEITEVKQDKPKPGKLDLSQFDNITNAIGKLNVQPPIKAIPIDPNSASNHSKIFNAQVLQNSPQESGFFKSRTKKVTSRNKLSTLQKESSGSSDQLVSFFKNKDRKQQQQSVAVRENQEFKKLPDPPDNRSRLAKASENTKNPSPSGTDCELDSRCLVNKGIVKDRSSRYNINHDVPPTRPNTTPTSSFLHKLPIKCHNSLDVKNTDSCEDESDEQPPPKPLRLSHPPSKINKAIPPSTGVVSGEQSHTTPSTSSSATSSNSNAGNKRLINPRHNHGRAVAPPQLPGSALTRLDSNLGESATPLVRTRVDLAANEEVTQLANEDYAIDLNQSPIAQRLLKQSKDYKVSELNSPYESENELTPILEPPRSQKISRGQNSGLENSSPAGPILVNSSIDSSELINSRDAAIRQLNEILANKQPPGRFGTNSHPTSRSAQLLQGQQQHDQQQFLHFQLQQEQQSSSSQSAKKNVPSKEDKKKLRDDEKMEKRRLKEEERLRRQEKKHAAKKSKSSSNEASDSVGDDGIPFFIRRCIEFIEQEGLDAEGIYRVPGNRAHVDAFIHKFKENPNMSIVESDIPVNAVATALKDFLSKKWGPIIPIALMNELTELSSISEKEQRILAVKQLIQKLPPSNYKLLKYVFSHFVKVSLNHSLNSMDSKNLAICWWPTLLPLDFSDMVMFEQMRPHLEESIQTMIDQYEFIFGDKEPGPFLSFHR